MPTLVTIGSLGGMSLLFSMWTKSGRISPSSESVDDEFDLESVVTLVTLCIRSCCRLLGWYLWLVFAHSTLIHSSNVNCGLIYSATTISVVVKDPVNYNRSCTAPISHLGTSEKART